MKSKKSIWLWILKTLLFLFGIALLAGGGIYLTSAVRVSKIVKKMQQPLIQFPVDFSKPGEYKEGIPSVQNYFHGLGIDLEVHSSTALPEKSKNLLEGLAGQAILSKEDGESVGRIVLSKEEFVVYDERLQSPGEVCLRSLESFPEFTDENCVLTLTVMQGVPGLRDTKQTLSLRYNLCGMESLLVLMNSVFGVVLSLAGLGITVPLFIHGIKRFRQRKMKES